MARNKLIKVVYSISLFFALAIQCGSVAMAAKDAENLAASQHELHNNVHMNTDGSSGSMQYINDDYLREKKIDLNGSLFGEEGAFIGQGVRTLFVLGAIIALIYLSLRVLRRFMSKGLLVGSDKYIRTVARHYLSQKQIIHVVQVGKRYFLLGTSERDMVFLSEIAAQDMTPIDINASQGNNTQTQKKEFHKIISKQESDESQN